MFKNKALGLAIIWLVVMNIVGLLAVNRFNLKADDAYSWMNGDRYNQGQTWNIAAIHSRWDSNWYQDVAHSGYVRKADDTLSNLVFFPLYPALVKIGAVFFQGNMIFSGWIISSLFLILSCVLLFRLVAEFYKKSDPLFAVFLLLIFPTAFFLNAVYTESLFLFLSLLAFYYTHKRNYLVAGIAGFLAALTRVTGGLLFLPLIAQSIAMGELKWTGIRKMWPLLFIPVGTATFFTYHWIFFGDPLLFFKIESAWGRSFTLNKEHFMFLSNAARANFYLDAFYLFFGTAVTAYLWGVKKYAHAIYMTSIIGVAVASGTLMSIGRYILILFPIYIVGAAVKNEVGKYAWILVSSMLLALNTYLFVNWYWAG